MSTWIKNTADLKQMPELPLINVMVSEFRSFGKGFNDVKSCEMKKDISFYATFSR